MICIAPGHGGFDPGAVGNGLREKDINLTISLALEKLLQTAGIEVVMTRTTDVAAGGAMTVQQDLENQCAIANDAKADLFFSIHTNAGGGHGCEAYVYKNSDVTMLARDCVDAVAPIMAVHGEPVKDGSNLWVVHNTNMPSVLFEVGFIDSMDAFTLQHNLTNIAAVIAPILTAWLGGDKQAVAEAVQSASGGQHTPAAVDLSNYVTKTELTTLVAQIVDQELKKIIHVEEASEPAASSAPVQA